MSPGICPSCGYEETVPLSENAKIRGSVAFARDVVGAVSQVTGVTMAAIYGRYRGTNAVNARIACAFIMMKDGKMRNPDIGEALGERKASSIAYYKDKFARIQVIDTVQRAREWMEDKS